MGFLDSLLDLGKSALGFFTGNKLGNQLARTALTGLALNQLSKSVTKENNTQTVDPGVRLQVDASTEHYVPVVYGTAWLGGIITEAVMSNNGGTMHYCLVLSEKTGNLLSTGAASQYTFGEIWRDDLRLVFNSDGITVASAVDRDGNVCLKPEGKIKVWCYAGNSSTGVIPVGYTGTVPSAESIVPGWTAAHTMSDTIFAIVQIDYDATKDIKGLGDFRFQITNSMTLPGDCLYDYMTNTRYGAGIPESEMLTT